MQSSSSTSSLLSSHQPQSSSKNWESTFGKLSSSYGFSGSVPSLPQKTSRSTKPTKSPRSTSPLRSSSCTSTSQSTSHKDYERTFGLLSSNYGFGFSGSTTYPCPPSKPQINVPKSKTPSVSPGSQSPGMQSQKDYEMSLGDLMVSNGFGGQYIPTRV